MVEVLVQTRVLLRSSWSEEDLAPPPYILTLSSSEAAEAFFSSRRSSQTIISINRTADRESRVHGDTQERSHRLDLQRDLHTGEQTYPLTHWPMPLECLETP